MAKKSVLPTEHRDEAEKIAGGPYSVVVIRDVDSSGGPVFLALNPELDGCIAHGKTSEEAIENLREARADYVQVLLVSGAPIPSPSALEEEYTRPSGTIVMSNRYDAPERDSLERLVVETWRPKGREVITQYAFKVLQPSVE